MDIKQIIALGKKHIVVLSGVASLIATLAGGVIAFESRYAKAAELDKVRQDTVQAVKQLRLEQIEDQIFALELIQNRTPAQEAMLKRLYRQREDAQK